MLKFRITLLHFVPLIKNIRLRRKGKILKLNQNDKKKKSVSKKNANTTILEMVVII